MCIEWHDFERVQKPTYITSSLLDCPWTTVCDMHQINCTLLLLVFKFFTDSGFTSKLIVDGKFTQRIRDEESIWSLVPGECIQIHIEKIKEVFWTALLQGEPEIDKTQLDTTRDISEFDEQTQSDFQKVMYDHRQKIQGKPTSEEQVNQIEKFPLFNINIFPKRFKLICQVPNKVLFVGL